MVDRLTHGNYPAPWDPVTNPPPIVGQGTSWQFTPEQSWTYYHPEAPQGYDDWTQYVLDVVNAQQRGQTLPSPSGGEDDPGAAYWLQNSIGYGRLAPLLDQSNPQIQQFLDSLYFNSTGTDESSIFGEMFFPALAALGIAGGATALAGLGSAGAAGAGAEAAAAGIAANPTQYAAAIGPTLSGGFLDAAAPAALGAGSIGGAVAPYTVNPAMYSAAIGPTLEGAGPSFLGGLGVGAGSSGGLLGTLGQLSPLIGAGTSILGSVLGANAARSAANTQAGAIQDANTALLDFYNRAYNEQAPYRAAGVAALGQLGTLADQPFSYGTYTAPAAFDPSQTYMDPSAYAFTAPNQALNPADYAFTAPNQALNPADYAFTPPSGQEVLNQDPGYQFRVQQGMKALDASASARGGLLSGAAVKGALNFGQGLASQEYGNAYNRLLGQNQMAYQRGYQQNQDIYGRALNENQVGWQRAQYGNEQTYNRALSQNQLGYERALGANQLNTQRAYQQNADQYARGLQQFQTNYNAQLGQRQQSYNELQNIANLGLGSTGNAATLSSNLGNALANNITSAGAANAAGTIGAGNAIQAGLGGVNTAVNSYLNNSLLQQQFQQQQEQNRLFQQAMLGRMG